MENNTTQKLVLAALFAALTFVATYFFKIPTPFKGYINLGDCVILVSAWTLSPKYSFCASGIGSALADILGGYVVYAPATFLIKGIMALIAYYTFIKLKPVINQHIARIIAAILAVGFMVFGYFVFETILYSLEIGLADIAFNAVQGATGAVLGIVLYSILQKSVLTKIRFI